MKRKVAGISLLFCLLAPILITYFFLQFQKKQVKREVKWEMIAGLDKEELVLLKLTEAETQSELRWENSKEFEYKDEMYDIVDMKVKGDTIYYWCWWDHKETKLNNQLDGLLAKVLGNNPHRQETENQLTDFFKKLFCENHADKLAVITIHKIKHINYSVEFPTIYHSPPDPPPR